MENNEQSYLQSGSRLLNSEERFAVCLKRIRLGLNTKQASISEAVGCSDAAVSLWESGSRIPTPHSLGRLLAVLAQEGTPTPELLELRRIWLNEYTRRRAARRG